MKLRKCSQHIPKGYELSRPLMTSSNTFFLSINNGGLIPYLKSLSQQLEKFSDALPTLASMTKIDCGVDLQPLQISARDSPAYCLNIEEEPDGRNYRNRGTMTCCSISRLGNILQGQEKRRTILRLSMGFFRSG